MKPKKQKPEATSLILPDVLRINPATGELSCADGRDARKYLAAWAAKVGAKPDTPINIMRREDQQRERDEAAMLRSWPA